MISVLLSLLLSIGCVFLAQFYGFGIVWTVVYGILGYLLGSLVIGLFIRGRLGRVQKELQEAMQTGQMRMQRQIQQAQHKPGANPAALQKQIELQQNELLKRGLKQSERMEPYQKWAPTLGRQITTMRLQFLYQLKRFDEVDELLAIKSFFKKPMLMEPTLVGMKMARAYKRGDLDTMEKTFKKHIRWMRGDRGTLLYGVMSWAWVKKGETEKAFELLAKGKDKTGNDTLAKNWEHLANDRVKKFSNAGLGEEWYALHLEPAPKAKMKRAKGRGRGGF